MKPALMVLLLTMLPASSAASQPFNAAPTRLLTAERLYDGDFGKLADESFDAMFKVAAHELIKAGYVRQAERLDHEWVTYYQGALAGRMRDVGDHQPISEWIAEWYAVLATLLGQKVMDETHLVDIWTLDFTIPVVFDPHTETLWCDETVAVNPGDDCKSEYRRHMAGTKWQRDDDPYTNGPLHFGFAPVVMYWTVNAACLAATWGAGYGFICTPIAEVAEIAMARFAAPAISDRIWERQNPANRNY